MCFNFPCVLLFHVFYFFMCFTFPCVLIFHVLCLYVLVLVSVSVCLWLCIDFGFTSRMTTQHNTSQHITTQHNTQINT